MAQLPMMVELWNQYLEINFLGLVTSAKLAKNNKAKPK